MSVANVSATWVDGNLVVKDLAGNIIFTVDGINRKVVFPSGAELEAPIGVGDLADGSVTKAKAKVFFSTEVTGTGSPQNVAHGLAAVPAAVLVSFTELPVDLAAGADIAEGAHDATNVVLTITTGLKVKVLAWA